MANLFAQVLEPHLLSIKDKQAMFELYRQYYGACNFSIFSQDLEEKNYLILLRNTSGGVFGFSTLMLIEFEFGSEKRLALFSGDTVIHHEYWGSQILALSWCRLVGSIKSQNPGRPLYWFLIVKGYRTYRYLPLFAKTFYPTWRRKTPDDIQQMMDYLAQYKFGDAYRQNRGVIQFEKSRGNLIGEWAEIPQHVSEHPDVKYFHEKNPGYKNGDELVCFTELTEDNLRSHALRAFKEAIVS